MVRAQPAIAIDLLGLLLSSEPCLRHELGSAGLGPASGDALKDVGEVGEGIGSDEGAIDGEREECGVALASFERADEEAVLAKESHTSEQSLHVGVRDGQDAVVEKGAERAALAAEVGVGFTERRLRLAKGLERNTFGPRRFSSGDIGA